MASCRECKIKFSKNSNLRAHVRRKHPEKLDVLAPKLRNQQGTHICQECNANFVNLANLRVHVKGKHPGKLEELAPIKQKVFECKHCDSKFKMLKDLTLHKKTICTVVKTVKCPLCQFSNPASTIIQHYEKMHAIQIDIETMEFKSFEEFKEWKIQVEKETYASFVNMHGFKQGVNGRKIKYTCHRSGDIRTRGKNIRTFKSRGSNKINGYCPAEMSVQVNKQSCVVKFCMTHVGHEQDLKHLFLSASDRQEIATKIASETPFQTILNDVKDLVSDCQLERIHLLTKKDIYNIKQAFNLNKSSVVDTNDALNPNDHPEEIKYFESEVSDIKSTSFQQVKLEQTFNLNTSSVRDPNDALNSNDHIEETKYLLSAVSDTSSPSSQQVKLEPAFNLNKSSVSDPNDALKSNDHIEETKYLISAASDNSSPSSQQVKLEPAFNLNMSSVSDSNDALNSNNHIEETKYLISAASDTSSPSSQQVKLEPAFNLNKSSMSDPNDTLNSNDHTEVTAVSDHSSSFSQQNKLFKEQQKVIQIFQKEIFGTNSIEELELIKKIVASLKPSLEALRSSK